MDKHISKEVGIFSSLFSMNNYNKVAKTIGIMLIYFSVFSGIPYLLTGLGILNIYHDDIFLPYALLMSIIASYILYKLIERDAFYWIPLLGFFSVEFLINLKGGQIGASDLQFFQIYMLIFLAISLGFIIKKLWCDLCSKIGTTNTQFLVVILFAVLISLALTTNSIALFIILLPFLSSTRSALVLPVYFFFTMTHFSFGTGDLEAAILSLFITIFLLGFTQLYQILKNRNG